MGCGTCAATAVIAPPDSRVQYDPKDDVFIYKEESVDPCQEHLRHKRPALFEFLAVKPSFVNPHPLTNGKLLLTPKLQKVIEMLELSVKPIKKIWQVFCSLDVSRNGFIILDDLFTLVKESHTSVVAPFLERIYEIAVKENDLYIYFDEFVCDLAAYCLMSHEDLVSFVFYMLDRDRDGLITKEGILEFLEFERGDVRVFPQNVTRAVELYEDSKSGHFSAEDFLKMTNEIKYLVFPAHRLQDTLREELLGTSFWEGISMQIEEKNLRANIEKKKNMLNRKVTKKENKVGKTQPLERLTMDENQADDINFKALQTFTIKKKRMSMIMEGAENDGQSYCENGCG